MDDKKIIITEDSLKRQPEIDFKIDDMKVDVSKNVNITNKVAYDMYQKYQNITLEKNHVLTLRRPK